MLTSVVPTGDPEEEPPDLSLRDLWERQCQQERQLEKQRHTVADLKEQLAGVCAELRELKGERGLGGKVEEGKPTNGWIIDEDKKSIESVAEDETGSPTYNFDKSMWDAVILLCFGDVSYAEISVLLVGALLNVGLQVTLLLVVLCDMLDNPYSDKTIDEMIKWRMNVGHSDAGIDHLTGQSLVSKLCNRTLWSYEQDQYQEMYDYLYKDMPGIVLSILAIILWVLTSMVEYRQVTEQALALLHLPRSSTADGSDFKESEEGIEIVAIRPGQRIMALLLVSLPRFTVLAILTGVGCKYLAQTASLSDIVLNAVALAFVLDVDELLVDVLLPERLIGTLEKLQPVPCGTKNGFVNKRIGGFVLKDLVRYFIMTSMVVFSVIYFLVPFHNNVVGAASALCGGRHDFTYTGGTRANPSVTIKNTSDHVEECDDVMMDHYVRRFYGIDYNASTGTASNRRNVDYTVVKTSILYNYAFKGCESGLILSPGGICHEVPATLQAKLPSTVRPGASLDPPVCARLNFSLGAAACEEPPAPPACLWSWGEQACDGEPPGEVHHNTCSESAQKSCEMWRDFFYLDHPTLNCDAVEMCPPHDLDCFSIFGTLRLDVRNVTALLLNLSVTNSVIKAGLASVASVASSSVEVAAKPMWRRRLEGAEVGFKDVDSMDRRLLDITEDNTTDFYYVVLSMPSTVKSRAVLQSQQTLVSYINSGISNASGASGTLSAVSFLDQQFGRAELMQATFMYESTSGPPMDREWPEYGEYWDSPPPSPWPSSWPSPEPTP